MAKRLGLETEPDSRSYDLIVVGGGQASYSAIIENYPGFPEGLSGSDLARRMIEQAERFGVEGRSIFWEGGTRRGRRHCCFRNTPGGW